MINIFNLNIVSYIFFSIFCTYLNIIHERIYTVPQLEHIEVPQLERTKFPCWYTPFPCWYTLKFHSWYALSTPVGIHRSPVGTHRSSSFGTHIIPRCACKIFFDLLPYLS